MPYIVCVNLPGCLPESDPVAVATIEEARYAASEELAQLNSVQESGIADRAFTPAERSIVDSGIGDKGGIVHHCDSGYVIDVQSVSWTELRALAGISHMLRASAMLPGETETVEQARKRQRVRDTRPQSCDDCTSPACGTPQCPLYGARYID